MKRDQKAFQIAEALVIAGVIVLIAGLGFVAWKSFVKSPVQSSGATATSETTAEVIITKEDLDKEAAKLKDFSFESSELEEAERQADV